MPRRSKADQAAKVSQAEADRRKAVALAEKHEMQRDQLRGSLLPKDEVTRVWSDKLGALKDRLLALPDRLGAVLAHRSEAEVRAALRDGLEDALRGVHADARR